MAKKKYFILSIQLLLFFSFFCHPWEIWASQEIEKKTYQNISLLAEGLYQLQSDSGYWEGLFETDPSVDAMMLIAGKRLNKLTPSLVKESIDRIFSARTFENGLWSSYPGGGGELGITGVVLLGLESANFPAKDKRYIKAKNWFINKGGWKKVHSLYRLSVAMCEQDKDIKPFFVSPTFFAIPQSIPINVWSVGPLRWFLIPSAIYSYYNMAINLGLDIDSFDNSHIASGGKAFTHLFAQDSIIPEGSNFWAQEGLGWILNTQQEDGTWQGVLQGTIYNLMALKKALDAGVADFSKQIDRAWNGLLSWRRTLNDGEVHQQFSLGPVMETALVIDSLRMTEGVSAFHQFASSEQKAIDWLISNQITQSGDWAYRLPELTEFGAWPYQFSNDRNPDVDDTNIVLVTLANSNLRKSAHVKNAILRGVRWVLAMQNKDGGFPVWEHETPVSLRKIYTALDEALDVLVDASQADITARAIRALQAVKDNVIEPHSEYAQKIENAISHACTFIENSATSAEPIKLKLWNGHWFSNYLYGTAQSLAGILSANCWSQDKVLPYLKWLARVQNDNGGFGESNESYKKKTYVPSESTVGLTGFVMAPFFIYETNRISKGLKGPSFIKTIEKAVSFINKRVSQSNSGNSFILYEPDYNAVLFKGLTYGQYVLLPHYQALRVLSQYLELRQLQTEYKKD